VLFYFQLNDTQDVKRLHEVQNEKQRWEVRLRQQQSRLRFEVITADPGTHLRNWVMNAVRAGRHFCFFTDVYHDCRAFQNWIRACPTYILAHEYLGAGGITMQGCWIDSTGYELTEVDESIQEGCTIKTGPFRWAPVQIIKDSEEENPHFCEYCLEEGLIASYPNGDHSERYGPHSRLSCLFGSCARLFNVGTFTCLVAHDEYGLAHVRKCEPGEIVISSYSGGDKIIHSGIVRRVSNLVKGRNVSGWTRNQIISAVDKALEPYSDLVRVVEIVRGESFIDNIVDEVMIGVANDTTLGSFMPQNP
jgi:hypothetical protein